MTKTTKTTTLKGCSCSCCSLSSASSSSPSGSGTFWQQNNVGVDFLNSGDYVRAFHCFRSALINCKADDLDELERSSIHPPPVAPLPDVHAAANGATSNPAPPPAVLLGQQQQQMACSSSSAGSEEGCIRNAVWTNENSPFCIGGTVNGESMMMIHGRAIPMIAVDCTSHNSSISSSSNEVQSPYYYCYSPRCHFFSTNPLHDKHICSAVIVFNLGLVYHLQALGGRTGSSHRQYLTRALSLYLQASGILSSLSLLHLGRTSTGNALVDLVLLALINNSADLTRALLDHESSQALFQQLIQFAVSVRECYSARSAIVNSHQQWMIAPLNQHVDSLLFHAMFSRMFPSATAPAA
jgi:hypothetical protein